MQVAIIGLGRMGANMARRLKRGGHDVVALNRTAAVTDELAAEVGVRPAYTPEEVVASLQAPRVVWLMLPAGSVTEDGLRTYAGLLSPGDILVDGANSNFHDTMRRVELVEQHGVHFVDVGVSGGVWGLTEGYSLMIGGDDAVVERLNPLFQTLAPEPQTGWGRVGPHGAGHYTKMVHNGIEYGMMEALAEGFEILRSRKEFAIDVHRVGQIWQQGSVVRSWLLDLSVAALAEDPNLAHLKGWVADSGEGRWTVFEAIDQDVPAPVITLALLRRFESRQEDSYAAKLLAAMRNQFGGHAVVHADGEK